VSPVVLVQALSVEEIDVRYRCMRDLDTEGLMRRALWRWNVLWFDTCQVL
jgi:hypothetical protein